MISLLNRRCSVDDRCIWKNYMCDHKFNCPLDKIPADEDGCNYGAKESEQTTQAPGKGSKSPMELNLISLTLGIVTVFIIIMLFLLLLIKYRRVRKCFRAASSPSSCELPEQHQPRSLAELSRQRHLREPESNVYMPLNTYLDQRNGRGRAYEEGPHHHTESTLQGRNLHIDLPEEPPPAYEELFPDRQSTVVTVNPISGHLNPGSQRSVNNADRRSRSRSPRPATGASNRSAGRETEESPDSQENNQNDENLAGSRPASTEPLEEGQGQASDVNV